MADLVVLVRHGRTAPNAAGLLLGRTDPPLDELGRAQAATLAEAVGAVDRVVASPLARAVETAEHLGLPVELDDRWLEVDYGGYEGEPVRTAGELIARWRADLDHGPPGGESLAAGRRPGRAGMAGLAPGRPGTRVGVSHRAP